MAVRRGRTCCKPCRRISNKAASRMPILPHQHKKGCRVSARQSHRARMLCKVWERCWERFKRSPMLQLKQSMCSQRLVTYLSIRVILDFDRSPRSILTPTPLGRFSTPCARFVRHCLSSTHSNNLDRLISNRGIRTPTWPCFLTKWSTCTLSSTTLTTFRTRLRASSVRLCGS